MKHFARRHSDTPKPNHFWEQATTCHKFQDFEHQSLALLLMGLFHMSDWLWCVSEIKRVNWGKKRKYTYAEFSQGDSSFSVLIASQTLLPFSPFFIFRGSCVLSSCNRLSFFFFLPSSFFGKILQNCTVWTCSRGKNRGFLERSA